MLLDYMALLSNGPGGHGPCRAPGLGARATNVFVLLQHHNINNTVQIQMMGLNIESI